MSTAITRRNSCRICGSSELRRFIHFEDVPFFDEVIPSTGVGSAFLAPMDVYWCSSCMIAQSLHDVDIEDYYKGYAYVASSSEFARRYMKSLADYSFAHLSLSAGDRVIDIGSADGYLLRCFKDLGADVLGFEPAGNLAELSLAEGTPVRNELFIEETIGTLPLEFQRVQAVVLLHTFDHLVDPGAILIDISRILDPERGVLLLEIHDLDQILDKRETALFGHEHTIYLNKRSLAGLLARYGFDTIAIDFMPPEGSRGSSMTIAASLRGSIHSPSESALARGQTPDEWPALSRLQEDVDAAFARLRDHIRSPGDRRGRVAGYGGWGRGVTTMAMARLTPDDLVYVCDRNTSLHGCYTPGTNIPIVSPSELDAAEVGEVIVFNYAYIDEIRTQLAGYIAAGGRVTSVLNLLAPSISAA